MSALPFGMVGAVGGHLLLGFSLSMMSLFGIVALTGVVVNASLVMIDFINRARREGADVVPAIMDAGKRRFRPIVMTAMTTFFGLAPMILETSIQARFLVPMAVALGFGVLFATFITLVLVPTLYLVVEDLRHLLAEGKMVDVDYEDVDEVEEALKEAV
jgi:multidrug efflux pump subunit AcrB